MSDTQRSALEILEGMAVICDCDTDAPVSSPDGHAEFCEVQSAYADAWSAVVAAPAATSDAAARAEIDREEELLHLSDDPTYLPFEGDDIDWLD